MLEIILFILFASIVVVLSIMVLTLIIAYATQSAYDSEKDINDD